MSEYNKWFARNENDRINMKRAFKWIAIIEGQGGTQENNIQIWSLKKCDKPKMSISETEHKYLNHTFYYPGRVTWGDITLSVADVYSTGDRSTAYRIMEQIRFGGYDLPQSNRSDFVCKKNLTFQTFKIQQFDCATEEIVEEWDLNNAWIKEVSFGTLDYGAEDPLAIDLTVKYDWCTYTPQQPQGGGEPLFSLANSQ